VSCLTAYVYYVYFAYDFLNTNNIDTVIQLITSATFAVGTVFTGPVRGGGGRSGTVGGRSPGCFRPSNRSIHSQTNTEKILYNKSRWALIRYRN